MPCCQPGCQSVAAGALKADCGKSDCHLNLLCLAPLVTRHLPFEVGLARQRLQATQLCTSKHGLQGEAPPARHFFFFLPAAAACFILSRPAVWMRTVPTSELIASGSGMALPRRVGSEGEAGLLTQLTGRGGAQAGHAAKVRALQLLAFPVHCQRLAHLMRSRSRWLTSPLFSSSSAACARGSEPSAAGSPRMEARAHVGCHLSPLFSIPARSLPLPCPALRPGLTWRTALPFLRVPGTILTLYL